MKKNLLLIIIVMLFAVVSSMVWWNVVTKAPSDSAVSIDFVVAKGKGATQIAQDLYKAGLIKSPLAFKFYVQLTGRSKSIGAGEFEIPKNSNMFEVLDKLSGSPLELWVTIPEGLRREEVVERFIKSLEIPADRVSVFRSEFLSVAEEGYMFPETYLFPRDISGSGAASRMRQLFSDRTKNLSGKIEQSNLSLHEIVTLASIVERETKTDEERPVVAGIYLNRIRIGMAIQADATAQYAVANIRCKNKVDCDWWVTPTLDDLEISSPYNTYKYQGIPPAPIASPGYSSIEAVVNPKESDYLYYIHDNDGMIHYAETLSEHNANVKNFLTK